MTIKTALLAGVAAALIAAPVLAQETTAPAPAAPAQTSAQPQSLTLTPGATVRGPDGELGKLEGVRTNAEGQQELTVRGADGQVRGVPLGGIRQEGADVVVTYTKTEYDAATPITGAAPAAPAAEPSAPPATESTTDDSSTTEPSTTEPADPSATTDPLTPPTGEEPTEPQTR